MNSDLSLTRRVGCAAAVAVFALGAAACEDPQPPAACGSLPALSVHVGETATVESCFSDPNGDMLTYSAASSSPEVATAATSGETVTVTAKALGTATITITAADPGGLEGTQTFAAEVPNRAPTPVGTVSRQTAHVGEGITILKDVLGTYTDVNGVERKTRAHRDGGWALALPDSFPPTDRREVFDLVCDADFDGFPAHRKPASDIEITVSWVVQYAVRDSGSPRRVRPDRRKGSRPVACPLAPS